MTSSAGWRKVADATRMRGRAALPEYGHGLPTGASVGRPTHPSTAPRLRQVDRTARRTAAGFVFCDPGSAAGDSNPAVMDSPSIAAVNERSRISDRLPAVEGRPHFARRASAEFLP